MTDGDANVGGSPFVDYRNRLTWANRLGRAAWGVVWALLVRPSPKVAHSWRRLILRAFGAKLHREAFVHPSVRVWAPWNLTMGRQTSLGDGVRCYSVDRITLEDHAVVSQYTYLCAASHDIDRRELPLVTAPITLRSGAWVAADAFIGPGVTVGVGAVVGARAVVMKDVAEWHVVAGNPARTIRTRRIGGPC